MSRHRAGTRVERELVRLRRRVWLLGAAVGGLLLAGVLGMTARPAARWSQAAEELVVRRLAIVDESGVERVILGTDDSEVHLKGRVYKRRSPQTGILLHDAEGNEVGGLGMHADGTGALVLDAIRPTPHEVVGLYVFPDGRAGFFVTDPSGSRRVDLGVDSVGRSALFLRDADEQAAVAVDVGADGGAAFRLAEPRSGAPVPGG